MTIPPVKFARSGDVAVAYQAWGDGPLTCVAVPPIISAIEVAWEEPRYERFLRRWGSFARVIHFDKRGLGASDRTIGPATLEERIDDLAAVMDAEGIERAVLGGVSEGGPLCMLFAASHPERVSHLLLTDTAPVFRRHDDYEHFPPEDFAAEFRNAWYERWGTPDTLTIALFTPSMTGDEDYLRWMNRYERASVSPNGLRAIMELNLAIDIRPIVSTIQTPALVMHRAGDVVVPAGNGRWLAENLPNATYVELEGDDHVPWIGNADAVLEAMERFLIGEAQVHVDRVLSTVVFTDIVGSTAQAAAMGDARWREVLDNHDRMVAIEVLDHGGRLVKSTGDGSLATFDGPARAIRCARRLTERLSVLGLSIRAGVHTGEIELRGDDIGGLGVHIGARIAALAEPGKVLVSRTVKDLVAGSGIQFADRGTHVLKGVPDEWTLFTVEEP